MRATYMYDAGDVRVIDIPDPTVQQPTDAVVRIVRACVCGSDLHPYHSMPADEAGTPMGHEFIGVVEAVGSEVPTLRAGDFVIAPFAWSVRGGVQEGSTVTVIGDGAVGLLAVLSAQQLGAERIVLMGRHPARTDLGREYGATDLVAERGERGIAAVRDITDGGSPIVLEAVGHMPAYEQAVGIARPGGVISRVGVPQYHDAPVGFGSLFGHNITLTGGPAPGRLPRAPAAGRPRRHGRARPRLRPRRRSGGHPEGLRSDGRAHRAQGHGPAVSAGTRSQQGPGWA